MTVKYVLVERNSLGISNVRSSLFIIHRPIGALIVEDSDTRGKKLVECGGMEERHALRLMRQDRGQAALHRQSGEVMDGRENRGRTINNIPTRAG